jgi:hypothetical protein
MHKRLDSLSAKASAVAVAKERRELEKQFQARLSKEAASARARAQRDAAEAAERKIAAMQKQLRAAVDKATKDAKASSQLQIAALERKIEETQKAADRMAKKAAREAAVVAERSSRKDLEILKQRAAKERAQHAAETARMKAKVDEMSIKLERQTSEQMGEMTEADVLGALKRAFPHDDIQRIDRGTRGADILHKVVHEGAEVGRIVYECKNTSTWQNEWLTKARGYRAEYQTQWVVIASRCFPRRQKWFVVEKGVPVIELRLVVRLAEVMRTAIVEIGGLRLTTGGRQAKAAQMFEYVIGDHFTSRFKNMGEAVAALREQQEREKQWHSEAWAKQVRTFDELDGSRREIHAQLKAIAEAPSSPDLRVVRGGG